MKIQNNINQESPVNNFSYNSSPTFKAGVGGMLNASGSLMQGIENTGFLGSFLIQDFGGMTIPRTIAGFLRDKEQTGHYNIQEGTEVFGREALTGPSMMAVAPISLLLAAKFGRSTSVNTQLIKRFGNSLIEMISGSNFDKKLLKNPKQFKQEFYKLNIEKILNDSLGKENTKQESIDFILKQINNMENIPKDVKLAKFRGKAKYRSKCMDNIIQHIDNIKYNSSTDLNMLQKVKFGSDKLDEKKVFSTKNTIDAMIKYSDDAITANKNLEKLDALSAENIKNKSLAKRVITNISMIGATLGVLSVLPKIYAHSNTAPGAKNKENNQNNQIVFKGREKSGILEKIGKLINKNTSDFISNELEYNGHNFTNTLMASLSVFGLLTPRIARALSRAQKDEKTGKKDYTEVWEIVLRDITSSLAVVFAVPMLTRACVTSYEKNSGFVLMQKDRSNKSKMHTVLDLLNPYSKAHVLTNSEINSLYNNIDSKEKMLNFCKYIDKNNGDLHKIISKSEHAGMIFDTASLKNMTRTDKNNKIISLVEKMDKTKADGIIKKVMKASSNAKCNKIAAFARGLTSIPGLVTTFLISPYILGWLIPRFTYWNTRRIHNKEE